MVRLSLGTAVPSEKKIETANVNAWKTLDLAVGWVKYADTKAAILLAASGVLGGLLFNMARALEGRTMSVANVSYMVLAAVAIAAGGVLSIVALKPRSAANGTDNFLYYTDLARRATNDGAQGATAILGSKLLDQQAVLDAIASQVVSNSSVARRKFVWGNLALMAFVVALLALLALGASIIVPL